MSIESIQKVNQTEALAREKKQAAAAQAKLIIRDAQQSGQRLLEQARKEAEAQVREALAQAEQRAKDHTAQVLAANARDCDALSAAAESHLGEAAALILKRIVTV